MDETAITSLLSFFNKKLQDKDMVTCASNYRLHSSVLHFDTSDGHRARYCQKEQQQPQ